MVDIKDYLLADVEGGAAVDVPEAFAAAIHSEAEESAFSLYLAVPSFIKVHEILDLLLQKRLK